MRERTASVSVLMSVYNGERYLREAVDSILNQTFEDFEFIIINDGSTDGTREILESYRDRRIRLFHQDNIGLTRSLNKGIRLARGEYIARMDADDISDVDRLSYQVALFEERPQLTVVATGARLVGASRRSVNGAHFSHRTLPALLLRDNLFAHGSIAYRRKDVIAVGGYDERSAYAQEGDLWLRFAWGGYKFGFVERPLYIYRWHEASISSRNRPTQWRNGLQACLRAIRRLRKHPGAFLWVDRAALRDAMTVLCGLFHEVGRADAAREVADAMILLTPWDVRGYKLWFGSLLRRYNVHPRISALKRKDRLGDGHRR